MTTSRRSLPAMILGRLALGNVPIEADYWEPTGALKFTTKPPVPRPVPADKAQRSASIEDWRACAR
jgi:hypothetical protein